MSCLCKPKCALFSARGAVQAGVICYLLFQVCGYVDGYFDRQEMPDQYTARNIAVTLKTVIRGLAYLMTFLFGANCLGLSGKIYNSEPAEGYNWKPRARDFYIAIFSDTSSIMIASSS